MTQNIISKDIANVVLNGLYCFGAYFVGTYIAANSEKIAQRIAFGRQPNRWVIKFFRLVGLYFIVSGVLLIPFAFITLALVLWTT